MHTCYLAKFKNCWEIIVCKKGKEIELIKLKDKFELKNKFVCDVHQYSLYQEITYNLLDYLIANKYRVDRVVIDYNGEIVKKAEFSKINIKNTDKIEIVCFVGGG